MFVINPEKYSTPTYRIGTFQTSDIGKVKKSNKVNLGAKLFFEDRFLKSQILYTEDGRTGIYLALLDLSLKLEDEVVILTSSGNNYIPKCVTDTIEKVCKWSMKITKKTKAILVNHEFGIPYNDLEDLKKYNLPIIEDCCTTFFTFFLNQKLGKVGKYVVFSFPKFSPIQIGGLLVSKELIKNAVYELNKDKYSYIMNVLSENIHNTEINIKKQLSNYNYLCKIFAKIDLHPRFQNDKFTVPSVFMFKVPNPKINLEKLKRFVNLNGIQSSIFYGERCFFIPCHYRLSYIDCDYFFQVVNYFLNAND